jgi:hypothetical protein
LVTDDHIVRKYSQIKGNAAERKLEFKLSLKKIRQLLERRTCYYTGVPFDVNDNSPQSRTFDRVDPNVGYIDSNVVACTKAINQLKANLSITEIKALVKKFK